MWIPLENADLLSNTNPIVSDTNAEYSCRRYWHREKSGYQFDAKAARSKVARRTIQPRRGTLTTALSFLTFQS